MAPVSDDFVSCLGEEEGLDSEYMFLGGGLTQPSRMERQGGDPAACPILWGGIWSQWPAALGSVRIRVPATRPVTMPCGDPEGVGSEVSVLSELLLQNGHCGPPPGTSDQACPSPSTHLPHVTGHRRPTGGHPATTPGYQ